MSENSPSVNTISNPAKLLHALMKATGIGCARALSDMLDIPMRTIQRLKLEIADANCANDAINGALESAKDAKDAIYGAPPAYIENARDFKELPSEVSSLKVEDKTSLSEVPSDQHVKSKPKSRRRVAYTVEFETFWATYPDTANNSKREAFTEWQHLLPAEQTLATDGLRHLAAHCRKNPDYRCVHACRYLKQHRWESYQPKAVPKPIAAPQFSNKLEKDAAMDAYFASLGASVSQVRQ